MIRKAIPFPFNSTGEDGINSKILKSVLVDLQAKTMKSASDKNNPAHCAPVVSIEIRYAIRMDIIPEVPPDIKAVFAFGPIKITEIIPQEIKKTP
jgi:hypothetical protein